MANKPIPTADDIAGEIRADSSLIVVRPDQTIHRQRYDQAKAHIRSGLATQSYVNTLYDLIDGHTGMRPEGDGGQRVYLGTGAPDAAFGMGMDIYVDIDSGQVYEKTANTWIAQINLATQAGLDAAAMIANAATQAAAAAQTALDAHIANHPEPQNPTEQRVLPDTNDASADTVDKIAIDDNARAFTTRVVEHLATPNTFTPVAYTSSTFQNVHDATPDPSGYSVGDWFVHGFLAQPRIIISRGGRNVWADASWADLGLTFIGRFRRGTVEEVAPHATANGEVFLDVDDEILRQVTEFVAGQAAATTEYDRLILADDEDVEHLSDRIKLNAGNITELETQTSNNRSGIAGLTEALPDPSVPDHDPSEAKRYELLIPAASGRARWAEATSGGGGGGGGISQSAFDSEVIAREAGDDPRRIDIADAGEYSTAIGTQASSDRPLVMESSASFSVTVSGMQRAIVEGGVYYIPPRSTTHVRILTLPQLGGGGDISQATFDAEVTARTMGDDPQRVQVNTANDYATAVTAQARSPRPLWIWAMADIRATVAGQTHMADEGDVIYFAPRSTSPKAIVTLPNIDGKADQDDVDAISDRADLALEYTRRLRPVSVWERSNVARTIYLEWKPRVAVALNAAIAVSIGGSANNIRSPEAVPAESTTGVLLPVPVNAANSGTITRSGGAVAGAIEVQVTFGGVVDTCWMQAVDAPDTPGFTFVRYANEAALPANVPANTVAWVPDS